MYTSCLYSTCGPNNEISVLPDQFGKIPKQEAGVAQPDVCWQLPVVVELI